MNATIAQMNGMRANDRRLCNAARPLRSGARLRDAPCRELPISMANVLEPLRNSQEMTLNGESAIPVTSVAVDAVLTGQQVISLRID